MALGVGQDIDKAVDFYRTTMGWFPVKRTPTWVEMESGHLRIFLCGDDFGTPAFALEVDDVPAALKELTSRGCELIEVPDGGDEPFVRDPFGYVFAVSPRGTNSA